MTIDLIQILPEYFREILEFKELMKTDQAVLAELEANIEQIRKNFYIQTADETTLAQKKVLFDNFHPLEKRLSTDARDCYRNIIRSFRFLLIF